MPELSATEELRLTEPSTFLIQKLLNQGHYTLFQVVSNTQPVTTSNQLPDYPNQSNLYRVVVGLTNTGRQVIMPDNLDHLCAAEKLTDADPLALLIMLNAKGFLINNLLLPNADDADHDLLCKRFYSRLTSDITSNLKMLPPSVIPTKLVDGQRLVFGRTETPLIHMLLELARKKPKEKDGSHPNLWLFRESARRGLVTITYLEEEKCTDKRINLHQYFGTNKQLTTKERLEIATGKIKLNTPYRTNFDLSLNNLVVPNLNLGSTRLTLDGLRITAKDLENFSIHIASIPVTNLSHKLIFDNQPWPEITKKELQILRDKISASSDNKKRNLWLIFSNTIDGKLGIVSCDKPSEKLDFNLKSSCMTSTMCNLKVYLGRKGYDSNDGVLPQENEATIHSLYRRFINDYDDVIDYSTLDFFSNLFFLRKEEDQTVYFLTKCIEDYEYKGNHSIEVEAEITRYQPRPSIHSNNDNQTQCSNSSFTFFPSLEEKSSQENILLEFSYPW